MKLAELIECLSELSKLDEYRADMEVVFGPDCIENASLCGGIIGKRDGLAVLMVAPLSLADVTYPGGGF